MAKQPLMNIPPSLLLNLPVLLKVTSGQRLPGTDHGRSYVFMGEVISEQAERAPQ